MNPDLGFPQNVQQPMTRISLVVVAWQRRLPWNLYCKAVTTPLVASHRDQIETTTLQFMMFTIANRNGTNQWLHRD